MDGDRPTILRTLIKEQNEQHSRSVNQSPTSTSPNSPTPPPQQPWPPSSWGNCTTGSIDVERVVKPFKHNLLRKERNRLSDENGIVLFRPAQNLRYMMKAKMALKGHVHDGLVQGGHSGYDVDHVMEEIDAE